jgi:hypothetical protein
MAKEKSSKTGRNTDKTVDAKVTKNTTVKHPSTSNREKNEIDELFASRPKSKEPTHIEKPKKNPVIPPAVDKEDWTDSKGERRKRRPATEEGYPIYSVQEMKIGLGGDTPDCPFDCQCCF